MLSGNVPEHITDTFFGANLCALNKDGGGIRPIAVGNTLRRLATKVGQKPIAHGLGNHFRPTQLGFETKGGCEAAVHATRQYLNGASHRRVLLKLDVRNAFNCMRRDVFLRAAREKAPSMYRLLWQGYHEPSNLYFSNNVIKSESGIQQGDPFGPALFSLGVDDITKSVDTEFNIWFLDDCTIGDSPEKVIENVRTVVQKLRLAGLELNSSKCELVILGHQTAAEVPQTTELFQEILPAPMSEASIKPAIEGKVQNLRLMRERLTCLEPHQGLTLLKNSF